MARGVPMRQLLAPGTRRALAIAALGCIVIGLCFFSRTVLYDGAGHLQPSARNRVASAADADSELQAALARGMAGKPVCCKDRIYQREGIRAVAFSHDGKYLATAGWSGIAVWTAADWAGVQVMDMRERLCSLAFSPDDHFLYVGGGAMKKPLLFRFDWRAGKLDRAYSCEGHHYWGIEHISLSPDGKQLCSDDRSNLCLWDVETGQAAPVRKCPWERYGPPIYGPFMLDGQQMAIEVPAFIGPQPHLRLRRFDEISRSARAVADRPLPGTASYALKPAVSIDGRRLAIVSKQTTLAVYALPDLKCVREFAPLWHGEADGPVNEVAFSPDGRWLAAAMENRPTPVLLDGRTGEEVLPYEGHGGEIRDLQFSADGRTLRSVGRDGTVCTWDTSTMKIRRRFSFPAERYPAEVRPWDGRYALCPSAINPKLPIQVVDLEDGKTECEVALPVKWHIHIEPDRLYGESVDGDGLYHAIRLYWLGEDECFVAAQRREKTEWWRFNYRNGQVLAQGSINQQSGAPVFRGELTEDGRHVFFAHSSGKNSPPWVIERTDLATLQTERLGQINTVADQHLCGLIPGGKYFYIGTTVYDRKKLRPAAIAGFPAGTGTIAFSPDGHRYAVSVPWNGNSQDWPSRFRFCSEPKGLVRVQDTLTGRTLLAFPSPLYALHRRFSPDGKQLAIAQTDGSIEIWPIPE